METGNTFDIGCFTILQGIYVNTDDFKSRVQVLASKFSPNYAVKTVLNQETAKLSCYCSIHMQY